MNKNSYCSNTHSLSGNYP